MKNLEIDYDYIQSTGNPLKEEISAKIDRCLCKIDLSNSLDFSQIVFQQTVRTQKFGRTWFLSYTSYSCFYMH